jgi:hypothetical protein
MVLHIIMVEEVEEVSKYILELEELVVQAAAVVGDVLQDLMEQDLRDQVVLGEMLEEMVQTGPEQVEMVELILVAAEVAAVHPVDLV